MLLQKHLRQLQEHNSWSMLGIYVTFAIIISLSIEVLIGNLLFWKSIRYTEVTNFAITAEQGLQPEPSTSNKFTVQESKQQYIDVTLDRPATIHNIVVSFVPETEHYQDFDLLITDDSSPKKYYKIGEPTVAVAIPQSHNIPIHAAGAVHGLRFSFHEKAGTQITVGNVSLNAHIPFSISWLRVLLWATLLAFILCLRPRSVLYNINVDLSLRAQRIFLVTIFVVLAAVVLVLTRVTRAGRDFGHIGYSDDLSFIIDPNQYNVYANSLLQGHLYLDLDVPQWLQHMDNPYDMAMRTQLGQETGQPYFWDYAFYQGKYYSYFGVLPVILAYIPFKLVTGQNLRTDFAVAAFAVLAIVAIIFCVYQILERYIGDYSVGLLTISILVMVVASQIVSLSFDPRFYALPNVLSLVCTLTGLGLWINATTHRKFFVGKLALGAVLIGLNLGDRPIFVLASFLALPIFWEQITKERIFFSKRGIGNTCAVIVPILACGIATMAYNYARFGSVFDFGVLYNLTSSNMVVRNTDIEQLGVILLQFFFQPYNIDLAFPFIHAVQPPELFNGLYVYYPYFAGLFFMLPTCICLFATRTVWDRLKVTQAHYLLLPCIALSLLVASVDGLFGAVHYRYISDFGWIIGICVILVLNAFAQKNTDRVFVRLLIWLSIISIIVVMWNLLSMDRDAYLQHTNPYIYYWFKSLFVPIS